MNGEGSQTDRNGSVDVDDNVVHLTDWLGPREELVPFGPGADAEDAAAGDANSAEAFWGERSSAVQDALPARPPEHPRRPAGAPSRPRGRASAQTLWARRRAWLGDRAVSAAAGRDPWRRRTAGAAVAVIAVLVLVGALTGTWDTGSGRAPVARSASVLGSGTEPTEPVRRAAAMARASRRLAQRPATHGAPSRRPRSTPTSRHRAGSGRSRSHRPLDQATPTAQPVGYTTPAGSATTSAPPTQTTAGSQRTTAVSSSPTATGAGATQNRSTSQPALGANGSLAPGSSPDG